MALRFKKLISSFIPNAKALLGRYQITVINALVTVILVATVVTVLLTQASALQRRTTEEGVINIAEMTALEVQSSFLAYYNLINNMAQIMSNYETFDPDQRRLIFDEIMNGVFVSERSLWSLYSIWKPNALDGLDSVFADADGNDSGTGQYNTGFTRERGFIEQRSFEEFEYLLNSNSLNLGMANQVIGDPEPKDSITMISRQIWTIDIIFPIYKSVSEKELVGIIGATVNLENLQFQTERSKPYGTGGTFISASNGDIFAHYNYNMRGRNLREAEKDKEPIFIGDDSVAIGNEILGSILDMNYKLIRTQDSIIVGYPLTKFVSDGSRYGSIASSPIPWVVVTTVPNSTVFAALNAMIRFSIFFIIGAGVLAVLVFFLTSRSLTQHARNLQRSLEQSTTMQDNLKYGLFLIDQKLVIQGAYSKALEKILSVSNLQGKNFIDLLSASVKETEKQGIVDYFDMIFKNAFDKELLEGINPINDFTYISTETGEKKSLRSTFTLAGQGRGTLYVLGTMEDITAEKELQRQLLEAENLRENEMRALFQVIQIDPRVLNDFVVDAEYEFERINELLKDKKQVQQEVLVEMYQSVHAIKSNALILNLESFSERLHKLESSVKALREEHEETSFDDFLSLILEFSDAMKEMDKLKETVAKIENFRESAGGEKNQDRYVLVETLTRVCNKTQAAVDKKVRFVVEGIDDVVLNYGPRRVIKEILTQLVRNAVYHGIERPEERTPLGKEPEGEIRLSIKHQDNQIVIKLTDNGGGIDFGRVRQTAEEHNLVHNEAEANDMNYLLKTLFAPGFSTLDQADFHAGRGMGLSLVKDRVKDLNGNITVSTAKGKGTTFTITIPLELHVRAADNAS